MQHWVALQQGRDGLLQLRRRQTMAFKLLIQVATHAAKRLPRHAARQVGVLYWRQWEGVLSVMFGQDDSSGGVSSSAFSGDRLSINWFHAASVGRHTAREG